jgi:NADH-quinone oxidoreductase subunit N
VVGGLLAFFVLAQAGIPFTGGFVAKLEIFSSAVDAGEYGLATIGALAAVVATFFYLRIVVSLFSSDNEGEATEQNVVSGLPVDLGTAVVLAVAAAAVLYAGVLPGAWLHFAKDATFLL